MKNKEQMSAAFEHIQFNGNNPCSQNENGHSNNILIYTYINYNSWWLNIPILNFSNWNDFWLETYVNNQRLCWFQLPTNPQWNTQMSNRFGQRFARGGSGCTIVKFTELSQTNYFKIIASIATIKKLEFF